MARNQRTFTQDLLWLKWPLALLLLVLLLALSSYLAVFYFRNDMQRREFQAAADLDLMAGQVREIETAEQIIVNNIDRFNEMLGDSILDQEDRVGLLEEIRQIRAAHKLFPVSVDIQEQQRYLLPYGPDVESPSEQISLRSTEIQIQLPLLHEGDLMSFLADFTSGGKLMVTSYCGIDDNIPGADPELGLIARQQATCEFYWYTLRREPNTGI